MDEILKYIDTDDVLLLYGSRQVGKTTLMKLIQNNYINWKSAFFDLENSDFLKLFNSPIDHIIQYLKIYSGLTNDRFYLFIDEVQYLDNPTSILKFLHDHYPNIKVIVSWSSTLEIRWKMKDSLVWRILKFEIYPLDFHEFLVFNWKDNLANVIWKSNIEIINKDLEFYYKEFVIWWWYPKVVLANNKEMKEIYLDQIYSSYIEKDIKDIWKIRQVEKFNKLLKILAIQDGNLLNISELSNTVDVGVQTIEDWILLLRQTFVIEIITPFVGNIRSELTKMPKIYFIDTWIRNYILDKFAIDWANFENSILSFFRNKNYKINFWRTQDKKEIDFVIDWIPYEVKLNYDWKKLTAIDYFDHKYDNLWSIITLTKTNKSKYTQLFPWEINI